MIWYAFFTFLCGFAQNYHQLFCIPRALQGLGFGGEWAAGAVLMGEVIRDKYRGRAVGIVQTGWSIGWGAAALLYTVFFAIMPEGHRLAGDVLDRADPRPAGVLDPPLRRGTEPAARHASGRAPHSPRSSPR